MGSIYNTDIYGRGNNLDSPQVKDRDRDSCMMHLTGIIDISITMSQTSVPACCSPHNYFGTSTRETQDLLQFGSPQPLRQTLQMPLALH